MRCRTSFLTSLNFSFHFFLFISFSVSLGKFSHPPCKALKKEWVWKTSANDRYNMHSNCDIQKLFVSSSSNYTTFLALRFKVVLALCVRNKNNLTLFLFSQYSVPSYLSPVWLFLSIFVPVYLCVVNIICQ